jgi:SSS family solute:Na+ symporter
VTRLPSGPRLALAADLNDLIAHRIAAVQVQELIDFKKNGSGEVDYNDAILLLMRDVLPNGLLGLAITGLLAAFMAGMAANISAFNTVFSYDLWQTYVVKDRPDDYYLKVGRVITVVATVAAIGTALLASGYSNLMDYLQQLFSFFNAPLFATFILGMFWKRMTSTAGWVGLVTGTASAVFIFILSETGVIDMPGQGASFLAAGVAFVADIVVSVLVSLATTPKPESELRGLVYSLTPKEDRTEVAVGDEAVWYRSTTLLASLAALLVVALNFVFA